MTDESRLLRFCLSSDPKQLYLRLLFIISVGIFAYSNTFFSPFILDDLPNIVSNPVVQQLNAATIREALASRRSFGIFTFQINYLLSGVNVFGYHLVNLLIHISAALMVHALLALLEATPYWLKCAKRSAERLPVPFFAALLFVSHPMQSQAVTYIVQRFASLATLLYLAAVVCYLKGRISFQDRESGLLLRGFWFALSLAAMLMAFKTKEIAYTLPAAIVLVELLFMEPGRKGVFRVLAAGVAVMAVLGGKLILSGARMSEIISRLDDATKVQTIISRGDYLLTQFKVICKYIWLLLLPVNQNIEQSIDLSHSLLEWRVLLAFLFLLALILLGIRLIMASADDKPYARLIAFGIFWFFLALSVESSILPIIDLIFEHRVYLPAVGFFTAVATAVLLFGASRNNARAMNRSVLLVLSVSLLFAGATWKRNLVWRDEVALWQDATSKNPGSARAWNNLGGVLISRNDGAAALRALIRSVEIDPSRADAFNNIGIALDLMGAYRDRFTRTTEMFSDPGAITERNVSRWQADAQNSLGLAYELTGNLPKAAESYKNAIGFNPALGIAYYNLALVSVAMRDYRTYQSQLQILFLVDPILADRLRKRVGDN